MTMTDDDWDKCPACGRPINESAPAPAAPVGDDAKPTPKNRQHYISLLTSVEATVRVSAAIDLLMDQSARIESLTRENRALESELIVVRGERNDAESCLAAAERCIRAADAMRGLLGRYRLRIGRDRTDQDQMLMDFDAARAGITLSAEGGEGGV